MSRAEYPGNGGCPQRDTVEPPCTERYARWRCAAKAARWMREGPSAGIDRQTRQITLRRSVKEAG